MSLSLVLLPLITVVEGGWSLNPPGKFPVNPLDPKIVEIAKFAVSEHNKESKANLVYEKVVRGTWDWTSLRHSGIKYNLIISANDEVDGMSKMYEAIVMSIKNLRLGMNSSLSRPSSCKMFWIV